MFNPSIVEGEASRTLRVQIPAGIHSDHLFQTQNKEGNMHFKAYCNKDV